MGSFKMLDPRLNLKTLYFLYCYHLNPFASIDRVSISVARKAYERFMLAQSGVLHNLYSVKDTLVQLANNTSIKLRIYSPSPNKHPILVYFHGGGWCIGSVNTHDNLCRHISKMAEYTVVSVEYRLAPENAFPIPADDAFFAYKWCNEHIEYLGGIEDRIAVGGDSAGGNIAVSLIIRCVEENYQTPQFQLLLYPTLDLALSQPSMDEMSEGYFITKKEMEYYVKNYLRHGEPNCFLTSPIHYARLDKLPPAIILTAECDPLRDDGKQYAVKLQKAGVYVKHREASGMIHAFMQMYVSFRSETDLYMAWVSEEMKKVLKV